VNSRLFRFVPVEQMKGTRKSTDGWISAPRKGKQSRQTKLISRPNVKVNTQKPKTTKAASKPKPPKQQLPRFLFNTIDAKENSVGEASLRSSDSPAIDDIASTSSEDALADATRSTRVDGIGNGIKKWDAAAKVKRRIFPSDASPAAEPVRRPSLQPVHDNQFVPRTPVHATEEKVFFAPVSCCPDYAAQTTRSCTVVFFYSILL
jgi:hypothetical protein